MGPPELELDPEVLCGPDESDPVVAEVVLVDAKPLTLEPAPVSALEVDPVPSPGAVVGAEEADDPSSEPHADATNATDATDEATKNALRTLRPSTTLRC